MSESKTQKNPIVLLTDFGTTDPFVGQMKGVIKSIAPDAEMIDLCHHVPPQNIEVGALFLRKSVEYFPDGTIFIAVVDPGVGTERKGLVAKSGQFFFVGPDNGLLSPCFQETDVTEIRLIENSQYQLPRVSCTFHGRDIFSPVAAHLFNGVKLAVFGEKTEKVVQLDLLNPETSERQIKGKVIHIDRFGNIWTNISLESLFLAGLNKSMRNVSLKLGNCEIRGIQSTYHSETNEYPGVLVINSFDLLEIAVPDWSAMERFELKLNDKIEVIILTD